jgi:dihydroorotate dehydrogenase
MTLYRALRALLFRLDPERAHELVLGLLATYERLLAYRFSPRPFTHAALRQEVWNLSFPNPVGLAAGFDKDACAPHVWPLFGFGFAEMGTVTAEAQPGNPRPRIFRLPSDRAVVNRLGFNNGGATAVAQRLANLERLRRPTIPLGINIGKSRSVPVDQAVEDYLRSFRQLYPFADYVVLNVSSPNTPGLRDLQAEEHLSILLNALVAENAALAQARKQAPRPLLVKIAPDLADEALAEIVAVTRRSGASGLVATNTTIERTGLRTRVEETGGLSGAPLRDRSRTIVGKLYRLAGPQLPIIGVGGIFSAQDAYDKILAGASLVQIYTGMVFEGPWLASRVAHGLVQLLGRDGFSHVREAVGRDA